MTTTTIRIHHGTPTKEPTLPIGEDKLTSSNNEPRWQDTMKPKDPTNQAPLKQRNNPEAVATITNTMNRLIPAPSHLYEIRNDQTHLDTQKVHIGHTSLSTHTMISSPIPKLAPYIHGMP